MMTDGRARIDCDADFVPFTISQMYNTSQQEETILQAKRAKHLYRLPSAKHTH